MSYYLKYTDDAELDLYRKTTLHSCNPGDEGARFVQNYGWVVVVNGLCGYMMDEGTEDEAITEALEFVLYNRNNRQGVHSREAYGNNAYLFEGRSIDGECLEGELFWPIRIVANISELTNKEKPL